MRKHENALFRNMKERRRGPQDLVEPGGLISALTRPNDRADPLLLISSPFRDLVGQVPRPRGLITT